MVSDQCVTHDVLYHGTLWVVHFVSHTVYVGQRFTVVGKPSMLWDHNWRFSFDPFNFTINPSREFCHAPHHDWLFNTPFTEGHILVLTSFETKFPPLHNNCWRPTLLNPFKDFFCKRVDGCDNLTWLNQSTYVVTLFHLRQWNGGRTKLDPTISSSNVTYMTC